MSVTRAQRDEAFNAASETAQRLCAAPESGEQLYAIAKRHDFADSPRQYRAYSLAVGDVILGFYEDRELPALLMQEAHLDGKTARAVTADLLEFLAPLHNEEAPSAAPAETGGATAAASSAAMGTPTEWASEIAQTEAAIKELQSLHTYASDQAQAQRTDAPQPRPESRPERIEPSHTSSQDDLLRGRAA